MYLPLKNPHCIHSTVRGHNRFASMVAISLLLHALAFAILFIRGGGGTVGTIVPTVDLNLGEYAEQASTSVPSGEEAADAPVTEKGVTEAEAPVSETEKLRENSRRTLAEAASQPDAVAGGSLGLGVTGGYFGSIGGGESLRDDIREYYMEMLRRINAKWWVNGAGVGGGGRRAVFHLVISRDGTIVDRMLVESSGNPSYDRALLKTLDAAGPLPPLPQSYRESFFQAPVRFNQPLNLLRSLNPSAS